MKRALLLLLLLFPAAARGGDSAVSLTVNPPPAKLPLAEPFEFTVDASLPGTFSIRPDTAAASNSEFEVVSFTRSTGKKVEGRRMETFTVKAKPFTLGVSTFPALSWGLSGPGVPDGTEVKSSSFSIEITPLFESKEGESIRDIYQPFSGFPWNWLLIALGLLALAVIIYLLLRKRTLPAAALPSWKDPRDPYQRARDRLQKLEKSPLMSAGKIKEYYIGLTSLLRFYLFEEFSIDASQMTTPDLSRELKKTGAGLKTSLRAKEFLQKADLVKFARLKPENAAADSGALADILTELHRSAEEARAAKRAAEEERRRKGEKR